MGGEGIREEEKRRARRGCTFRVCSLWEREGGRKERKERETRAEAKRRDEAGWILEEEMATTKQVRISD